LSKLSVVDISLDREQDNPQLIFESMNSTGLELSQADLIRNYVLMGLEPDHQAELYKGHWRPMELKFGQNAYGAHFDSFMRHYLTFRTGDIPKIKAVYEAFKAYSRKPEIERSGVDELVRDLQSFAGYYCAMALGDESDPKLNEGFQDLRELGVEVAYPLLLEMYHDYATQVLPRDDFEKAVRLVEAYVFRRAICGIPTNSMNRTFANFTTSLEKDRYLESVQAVFQLLPSYRRFPADDEFKQDFVKRDLYNFARRSYWLRRLENHNRKERVSVDEYTIEHIMPQNESLSEEWRQDLGPDWERVQREKLHTLGNLTLTRYNSEYSDRPFREKRDMEFGFGDSPLRLNEGLQQIETWDETAIDQRANRLANLGPKVWRASDLSGDVLDAYMPSTESVATLGLGLYTVEDHFHIATGAPMREIFDELSRELKALDPCISEEFLKLYVAYKAVTNFVDIVPQAKRLLLSVNLGFHELHDPRGIARDVTDIGTWGNGDIDVGLASSEDIPYVVGLVRQALEKQMGDSQD
jgi:predicted transport protein